ncbi:DUF819 domain-containing protein [Gemmatimonadota bacterium]
MIQSPLFLTALIAVATALAFVLDRRVRWMSKIGASLLALVFGAILSNFGLVPADSPVYGVIEGPVTSLAIAWLLLAVNLSDLKVAGPRMIGAFLLAAFGTAVGAFLGGFLFSGRFGENTWRLAGVFTGTYSGGSVNFVSVGQGVELPGFLFAGATAADALTTGIWLAFTLLLPLWLRRFYPAPIPGENGEGGEAGEQAHPFFEKVPLSTLDLANLLAAGFFLVVASQWVGSRTPGIPAVLWLTTFALIVGHLKPFRKPRGALQLGNLALHFFFVIIGIHSRISEIMAIGMEVFYFTLVVVGVHGLVVFGVGRVLRMDIGSLAVASQAAVGGPSSALAVAVSREWKGLVLPGIIVGLLGYALGNYLGFAVAFLLRGLGVGL